MIKALEESPRQQAKTVAQLQRLRTKRDAILSGKPLTQEAPKPPQAPVVLQEWNWTPSTEVHSPSLFQISDFVSTRSNSPELPVIESTKSCRLPPISQLLASLDSEPL